MVFVVIVVLLIAIVGVYALTQRAGKDHVQHEADADKPGARAEAEEEELEAGARQHRDRDFGQDRPQTAGEQEVIDEKKSGDIVDEESTSDAS